MKQLNAKTKTKGNELMVLVSSTILITLFLFFIDEGYYNFKWMTNLGSWIVFIVYAAAIFLGQLIFSNLLLKKYQGIGKTLISVICGSSIGILFVIGIIFTNW